MNLKCRCMQINEWELKSSGKGELGFEDQDPGKELLNWFRMDCHQNKRTRRLMETLHRDQKGADLG